MRVAITVDGGTEALRGLRRWLTGEADLRDRVMVRERPPGPVLEALVVALAPDGVAAALVTGIVTWLRHERGDLTVRVQRGDGSSFEITAARVRGLDAEALRAEIERLAAETGRPS